MRDIEIITVAGRPAAIVTAGQAIISEQLSTAALQRAQAKALYALQIQAGERPGPYRDADAESYARSALRAARRTGADPRAGAGPCRARRVRRGRR
jgi:hypothetical protein